MGMAGRPPMDPGGPGARPADAPAGHAAETHPPAETRRPMGAPGTARGAVFRVAPLDSSHRSAIEEIVRATGVFGEPETRVAIELFDETYGSGAGAAGLLGRSADDSDYEFLGLFAEAERPVGYACFGPTPGTDRGYDLYWIAVTPAAQGTGGGTFLIGEVEHRLRERNARLVVAETSSRHEYAPTRAFYVARGYREAARVREFYGPSDDRIIFTKRLQPPPRVRGGAGGGAS
jgi:GNAT superfamily N-acetyltransferase